MAGARFLYLAAVIAAHKEGVVRGRTRLQKTMKLLQSKGLPSNYLFSIYHYGPYCEELHADSERLRRYGLVEETKAETGSGFPSFHIRSIERPDSVPEVEDWRSLIERIEDSDITTLELAATFTEFYEREGDANAALELLVAKKGSKCSDENLAKMKDLLFQLELPCP